MKCVPSVYRKYRKNNCMTHKYVCREGSEFMMCKIYVLCLTERLKDRGIRIYCTINLMSRRREFFECRVLYYVPRGDLVFPFCEWGLKTPSPPPSQSPQKNVVPRQCTCGPTTNPKRFPTHLLFTGSSLLSCKFKDLSSLSHRESTLELHGVTSSTHP